MMASFRGKSEHDTSGKNQLFPSDWDQRIAEIDWSQYRTAYGDAGAVRSQLRRLRSVNEEGALSAAHDLWCGLCHQHVQIGSAALPALPFLVEAFDLANNQLKVELMDTLEQKFD